MKGRVIIGVGKANFPEDVAETLRQFADVFYASTTDGAYPELKREADAVVVGSELVDDNYLSEAPNLRIIARFGVGYDSVDVDACTRRRVYVSYTPDVLSAAVADLTWGLILSLARKLPEADEFVRREWGVRRGFSFGWDVEDKTLGIIGLGRIGSKVALRATGFGMKIIYYDIVRKTDLESRYGFGFVEFDDLLRRSDIVSLHVPLLKSTRHLIGGRELGLMKPTALLINTSRGAVVDQEALIEALEGKRIRGAGLDVFEEEPVPLESRLLKLENVMLTPHVGSATVETRRRMAVMCSDNVRAVFEGRRPPNLVPEQENLAF